MAVLSLPPIPADYDGIYVATYSVISGETTSELAGRAFFEKHERARMVAIDSPPEPPASSTDSVKEETSPVASDAAAGPRKKNYKEDSSIAKRVRDALDEHEDLYGLCCVKPHASVEEIKKQFRRLALLFHPDKSNSVTSGNGSTPTAVSGEATHDLPDVSGMTAEELHERFLKVHNAFEILSDKAMRRQYDSHLPFDDRLPIERDLETCEDFFAICRPAFEKEARWCTKEAPELGDINTPIDQVKDFYRFWANYESWRDFSNAGEHNLEEAQDKEEKKWMQKENWRIVKGLLRQERARVLRFVALAEQHDPRLKQARSARRPATAPTKAVSKAKALADMKAAIAARRSAVAETKQLVKYVMGKWVSEKSASNSDLDDKVKRILECQDTAALKDLIFKLNSTMKYYKSEPCEAGAEALKKVLMEF